jgi:ribulose-phosphate 3-epimerase
MSLSRKIRLCPSILNANRDDLTHEIVRVASDSDLLHLDVMDNIFVPNETFSFSESQAIIESSPIPVDAHLMIFNPDEKAHLYARAGAKSVTFHLEASENPLHTISAIKENGARASIAVKPATPFAQLEPYLSYLDMVLVMTVEPGFGGQSFMSEMMPKVAQARAHIDAIGSDIWLQVDGGISVDTIMIAAKAGADAFVAGSAVYKAQSPSDMLRELKKLAVSASGLE